jgi:hypothetical protein
MKSEKATPKSKELLSIFFIEEMKRKYLELVESGERMFW